MNVTVTQGVQVCHDGAVYRDGASADVPESVARQWVRNGWANIDLGRSSDRGPSGLRDARGLVHPSGYANAVASADDRVRVVVEQNDSATDDTSDNAVDESSGPGPAKVKAAKTARARVRRDPRKPVGGNEDE